MQRVQRILANTAFFAYVDKIAKLESERRFCKHDLQHFLDTARISYILFLEALVKNEEVAQHEEMRALLYATGLLHDIGRWLEYEEGTDHAMASAGLAEEILLKAGFDQDQQTRICLAIAEHRGGVKDRSILGQFLYRADKMARPCLSCEAKAECYKYEKMVEAKTFLEY